MPAADAKPFAFPKSSRLKSSLLIKEVVQQGRSVFCYPIKCFYMESAECADSPKIAFLVSKRRLRHATARNRVKRLMRESYRLHRCELSLPESKSLAFCWMFVGTEIPDFPQVESAASRIFQDLHVKLAKDGNV